MCSRKELKWKPHPWDALLLRGIFAPMHPYTYLGFVLELGAPPAAIDKHGHQADLGNKRGRG